MIRNGCDPYKNVWDIFQQAITGEYSFLLYPIDCFCKHLDIKVIFVQREFRISVFLGRTVI